MLIGADPRRRRWVPGDVEVPACGCLLCSDLSHEGREVVIHDQHELTQPCGRQFAASDVLDRLGTPLLSVVIFG